MHYKLIVEPHSVVHCFDMIVCKRHDCLPQTFQFLSVVHSYSCEAERAPHVTTPAEFGATREKARGAQVACAAGEASRAGARLIRGARAGRHRARAAAGITWEAVLTSDAAALSARS